MTKSMDKASGNPASAPPEQGISPQDVEKVLAQIKDEPVRKQLIAILQQSTSRQTWFGRAPEFHEAVSANLNAEHVTQIIKFDAASEERAHHERGFVRRYTFAAFLVIAILALLVVNAFKDNPTALAGILGAIGGLVGGALGGFGIGTMKGKRFLR